MRLEHFRAALASFFLRRAEEIQRNIDDHRYADHRALWLARKAELLLFRQIVRRIEKGNGDEQL